MNIQMNRYVWMCAHCLSLLTNTIMVKKRMIKAIKTKTICTK